MHHNFDGYSSKFFLQKQSKKRMKLANTIFCLPRNPADVAQYIQVYKSFLMQDSIVCTRLEYSSVTLSVLTQRKDNITIMPKLPRHSTKKKLNSGKNNNNNNKRKRRKLPLSGYVEDKWYKLTCIQGISQSRGPVRLLCPVC